MNKRHNYFVHLKWTGNKGMGTADYKTFDRDHIISSENKAPIYGSSDAAFRGDPHKYNPEELLLSSLSACHMLWYLHLCAVSKVVVTSYLDSPHGIMVEEANGKGYFTEVILNPRVTVAEKSMVPQAIEMHKQASTYCFIANSVNFSVRYDAIYLVQNKG